MDAQKKQKVLLAGLAVCVLGAGSVFTYRAFSDSGPVVQQADQVRQTGRRQRAETEKVGSTRKERGKRKAAKTKTVGRRERKDITKRTTKRKGKKRTKAKRMKKTELKPMG